MSAVRTTLRKTARLLAKILLGFAAFIALYFVAAWMLSRFGVKEEAGQPDQITIYIWSNGVHTDVVMPVRHRLRDWSTALPFINTRGKDTTAQYIGLGWGDRGFYLETPTWADLKFSTAFKACFWLGRSAVHATYYRRVHESKDCVAMQISEAQYARLIRYIDNTFDLNDGSTPVVIPTNAQYSDADAFYEARRRYSFLRTCNVWANDALKACGQKAAVWAPFDWGIFHQYRKS
jgi:uncharacterized protein (TIGR02117 family)